MYPFENSPLVMRQTPYTGRQSIFTRAILLVMFLAVGNFIATIPSYIAIGAVNGKDLLALLFSRDGGGMTADEYATAVNTLISNASGTRLVTFTQLIGKIASAGAVMLFALCIEKRTPVSLGLGGGVKKSFVRYACGGIIGAAVIALTAGICTLTGTVTVTNGNGRATWILLFLCGFLILGFYEEILIHGYVMTIFLGPGRRVWLAVGVSSFLFAMMNLGNTGIGFTEVLNLLLFATLTGLLTLRTGSLYIAWGLNTLRAFFQMCVFGRAAVTVPDSLFRMVVDGHAMTNGGEHGIGRGLVFTLILLVSIILVMFLPSKSAKFSHKMHHNES